MDNRNYELMLEHLQYMSSIPVTEIDRETVRELSEIIIDPSLSPAERIMSLLRQTNNPYAFRDGDVLVKVSFSEKGRTLKSCMEEYFKAELQLSDY